MEGDPGQLTPVGDQLRPLVNQETGPYSCRRRRGRPGQDQRDSPGWRTGAVENPTQPGLAISERELCDLQRWRSADRLLVDGESTPAGHRRADPPDLLRPFPQYPAS